MIYRTQLFNPADMDNVKKIQAGYKVQPLSALPAASPRRRRRRRSMAEVSTRTSSQTDFAEYLDFLLQFCSGRRDGREWKSRCEQIRHDRHRAGQDSSTSRISPPSTRPDRSAGRSKDGVAKIEKQRSRPSARRSTAGRSARLPATAPTTTATGCCAPPPRKLGIYGNDAAEATYPFTRNDGRATARRQQAHVHADLRRRASCRPSNAFWSVTMYDGKTQLLIENPINRYLINSPMLPDMKKNNDGSLTIYIQKDSPGKDKESNWLPAPDGPIFLVMRLYWPKTEPPSILPPGEGDVATAGVVPVARCPLMTLDRLGRASAGDKSLENIIRTDERYGHDGLFHGPRGKAYWNHLEYPKPIQNPNLWPDTQSTYFIGRLAMPAGSTLTLRFQYPHARYFQFALYKSERNTFVVDQRGPGGPGDRAGSRVEQPVPGRRRSPGRAARLHASTSWPRTRRPIPGQRARNTLYAGAGGGEFEGGHSHLPVRSRPMMAQAGGRRTSPSAESGFPTYEATLADGTKLSAAGSGQAIRQADCPPPASR